MKFHMQIRYKGIVFEQSEPIQQEYSSLQVGCQFVKCKMESYFDNHSEIL